VVALGAVTAVLVGRSPHRSGTTATTHPALALPLDPDFVGPSYYRQFSNGPSSSPRFFPIYTYQVNLQQWSRLPARIAGMGVDGIDDAYDAPAAADYRLGRAHGLQFNVMSGPAPAANRAVVAHAMVDEPNQTGSPYAASSCTAAHDSCAHAYAATAASDRRADPTRPVWGNFTTDADEWIYPPAGWTASQFDDHETTLVRAVNIASSDVYGWTDRYQWSQGTGQGTGHFGAWVYGHTVQRLIEYNSRIPVYGFVECCDSTDGDGTTKPTNEMMPGMLQAAVWNLLVHGARGYVFWTTNSWDSSPHGDPYADPERGATYQGNYALYAERQWNAQYDAARDVNRQVRSLAPELNSPTVTGITATAADGVPVATLGKDVGGKLWLLAQADGDTAHPLSNTATTEATITLPAVVPPGTRLTVLGEHRTVVVTAAHQITDSFGTTTETPFSGRPITYGYRHHIYVMR
jgi:hypothetical protein